MPGKYRVPLYKQEVVIRGERKIADPSDQTFTPDSAADEGSLLAAGAILVSAITGAFPGAVTSLAASAGNASQQTLTWTASGTGTGPMTYSIAVKKSIGGDTFTTVATGVSALTYTVSGLNASTQYDYRVIEVGSLGHGPATMLYAVQTGTGASTGSAPTLTSAPSITGTPQVGVACAYTPAVFVGTGSTTRQWTLDGTPISGATGATYTPVNGDATHALRIVETLTTSNGSISGTSSPVTVAAASGTTHAKFGTGSATAGVASPAALFASMADVTGATTDRNGSFLNAVDANNYTWVAVTAAAASSGMHFNDGTGFGGFNGAQSAGIYSGSDADPTVIHATYNDGTRDWNLYRKDGKAAGALTYTLS